MDLFWIDETLAVATRPRGGDWLEDEMAAARRADVDIVVSCLTPAEEEGLALVHEGDAAEQVGLGFMGIPIEDGGVPRDQERFREQIDRLRSERRAGRHIAVHCRQGLGRSPLVAAALLVHDGLLPDDAWALIAERRNAHVPETDEQRQWIDRMASSSGGHRL